MMAHNTRVGLWNESDMARRNVRLSIPILCWITLQNMPYMDLTVHEVCGYYYGFSRATCFNKSWLLNKVGANIQLTHFGGANSEAFYHFLAHHHKWEANKRCAGFRKWSKWCVTADCNKHAEHTKPQLIYHKPDHLSCVSALFLLVHVQDINCTVSYACCKTSAICCTASTAMMHPLKANPALNSVKEVTHKSRAVVSFLTLKPWASAIGIYIERIGIPYNRKY